MGKSSRDEDFEDTFSLLAWTSSLALYRMFQTPSKRRTDEETRLFVRSSIRLFVSLSVVSVGRPSYGGETNLDASQKFKMGG